MIGHQDQFRPHLPADAEILQQSGAGLGQIEENVLVFHLMLHVPEPRERVLVADCVTYRTGVDRASEGSQIIVTRARRTRQNFQRNEHGPLREEQESVEIQNGNGLSGEFRRRPQRFCGLIQGGSWRARGLDPRVKLNRPAD